MAAYLPLILLGVTLVVVIRWSLRRDEDIRDTYPDEEIASPVDELHHISQSQQGHL